MKLEDIQPGDRVVFIKNKVSHNGPLEYGEVTSKNDTYVFVRYDGYNNSKATRPEDLKKER